MQNAMHRRKAHSVSCVKVHWDKVEYTPHRTGGVHHSELLVSWIIWLHWAQLQLNGRVKQVKLISDCSRITLLSTLLLDCAALRNCAAANQRLQNFYRRPNFKRLRRSPQPVDRLLRGESKSEALLTILCKHFWWDEHPVWGWSWW